MKSKERHKHNLICYRVLTGDRTAQEYKERSNDQQSCYVTYSTRRKAPGCNIAILKAGNDDFSLRIRPSGI